MPRLSGPWIVRLVLLLLFLTLLWGLIYLTLVYLYGYPLSVATLVLFWKGV